MGKIVLEIEEFGKTHSQYQVFDQECIRIGRAFDNDLIINDPFVNASHVSLKLSDGKWVCENHHPANGTFLSTVHKGRTKIAPDRAYSINSGDTIFLGKTSIRVWDVNHPVPAERVQDRTTLLIDPRKSLRSLFLALGSFFFLYFLHFSQWYWKRSFPFFQIVLSETVILFFLVFWAGSWALITRFSKRHHRFGHHFIFTLQWSVLGLAAAFVLQYIGFFMCNQGLSSLVTVGVFGLFSVLILNIHLGIGTNLSSKQRMLTSALFIFSLVLFFGLGGYVSEKEFDPDPEHYIAIVPVQKKFIPVISVAEEINRLDSVFKK